MPERIVDRLEAVDVDEQDRELLAQAADRLLGAIGAQQRLGEAVLEQHAVRQARQRVEHRALAQLVVGRHQAGRDAFERAGQCFPPTVDERVDDGAHQRAAEQQRQGHRDHVVQEAAVDGGRGQADRIDRQARRQDRRRERAAEHQRQQHGLGQLRREALQADELAEHAKRGEPQDRCDEPDAQGQRGTARTPCHSRSEGGGARVRVVQGRERQRQDERADRDRDDPASRLTSHQQCEGVGEDRARPADEQRLRGVADRDRHHVRGHADEVGRPQAGTAGQTAADPPQAGDPALRRPDAASHVLHHVGGQPADRAGKRQSPVIDGGGEKRHVLQVEAEALWARAFQGFNELSAPDAEC